jgi:hypothetical protein
LQTLKSQTAEHTAQPAERRNELLDQLKRLQDLYVLSDLTKAQFIMRRQALEEELRRQGPSAKPAIDRAAAPFEEFLRFWEIETQPAERRKLLLSLFEQVWAQEAQISPCNHTTTSCPTSKPHSSSFKPTGTGWCRKRERRGSKPRLLPRGLRSGCSAAQP